MSVATTSRRLEQYDVIRLQDELLELAHRFAVDMEFSGGARLAAAEALGRLLDAVKKKGATVFVVLAGDHGESLGEHGEGNHGVFLYQATQRVPLIVIRTPTDGNGDRG